MLVIKSEWLRKWLKIVLPFLLIPSLVLLTPVQEQAQYYALISFLTAIMALLLFFAGFDRRELGTRRMILVSAMTALSVLGRLLPLIKPITALTVLSAMYLGPEAGFLVGALSAVLSNFVMGQGPWTPFQMLGFGLIGLFAGYLSRVLLRSRVLMLLYGVLAGIGYSFLMDVWTVLWYAGGFEPKLYLTAIISAIPFTLLYTVSNILFLLLLQKPVGNKLSRIKKKYGV